MFDHIGFGARGYGPQGLRPDHHPHFYGAFAVGPDGHNFEAACHRPE